jgi:hypothetical protein
MMLRSSACGYLRVMLLVIPAMLQLAPASADWDIPELMHALASSTHPAVPFQETRSLAYLDVALTSRGVLSIDEAGRLIKETTAPEPERLIIDHDALHSTREGEDEVSLSLGDYPVIRGFVEAFRATLQGDSATLSRYYLLELQGGADSWSLQLKPQQASLGAVIRVINVKGIEGRVTRFTVEEQSGDSTTLRMTEQ